MASAAAAVAPATLLPTDVLTIIFAYAPTRARLRALSPVCKRWRVAALRSVTSLTFYRHHVDTWDLRALHRLLPSLTDLTIAEYCPSQYVITSLRCLALDEFVLIRLFDDEAANYGSTLLTATLPSLTSLSLTVSSALVVSAARGSPFTGEDNPIVDLLSAHSTQLATLAFHCHCQPIRQAVRTLLHFPALTALAYTSSCGADLDIIHHAPLLHSLELTSGHEVLTAPPAMLTSLTRLHCPFRFDSSHLRRLQPFDEHRVLNTRTAWDVLRAIPNVSHLEITPAAPLPSAPARLPYLRSVRLTDVREGWDVNEALRFASLLLAWHADTLRSLGLFLRGALSTRQRKQLTQLVWQAMQLGVRDITIEVNPPATLWIPVAECGWVDVRVALGKGRFRLMRDRE